MNTPSQHYYNVSVPGNLAGSFTYHWLEADLKPGCRVLVPFGVKKIPGVVVKSLSREEIPDFETKSILRKLEEEHLFSDKLLNLANWLSSYYHTPLGEVLRSMIPTGTQAKLIKTLQLSEQVHEAPEKIQDLLQKLFGKNTKLALSTVKKKHESLKEIFPSLKSLTSLKKNKWILETLEEKEKRTSLSTNKSKKTKVNPEEKPPELTNEQRCVFENFLSQKESQKPLKPFLLHGVTGSGKTEVYMRILENVIKESFKEEEEAQALVLVPEISLTPQMRQVFERRFPGKVSILHSVLSDKKRYNEILQLFHGKKQILIGARSCVFAPFKNLKLIIVDEEHDSSYKQNTQFCYHAKDVAIVRGRLESIPVILGSATPSAESYQRAKEGSFNLLEMQKRVNDFILPKIHIKPIEAGQKGEKVFLGKIENEQINISSEIISQDIERALRDNFQAKKQSIVLVNRRGYAYYLLDLSTKKSVLCTECSVSMTLHNNMKTLTCHYCEKTISTKKLLEESDSSFVAIGNGSEKLEKYLMQKIPEAKIVRLDSDTARNRENLEKTLENFRQHKIDILVGTQILAKGHDFPKVTFVALLEVDEQLNLPDFRAGERTFQLLVQAAGRAGRAGEESKVYLQTIQEHEPLIQDAIHHNYKAFIERELAFREKYAYPPFYKLALLSFSSLDLMILEKFVNDLSSWIETVLSSKESYLSGLRIQGPYKPGIERINRRWRRHFLLRSKDPKEIHSLIYLITSNNKKMPIKIRFKVDIDPQSLL